MNIVSTNEPRIISLDVSEDSITARLADGRTASVPIAWSWRLSNATARQRSTFEFIGNGKGIHWPEIDEDVSARGMLQGTPARPPTQSKTAQESLR